MKVFNMFREFSMKNVKGYNGLSNEQKDFFDATYKKHLASMSCEERMNYTERHVKKVVPVIGVLKVSYDNGESFLYLPSSKWVQHPIE